MRPLSRYSSHFKVRCRQRAQGFTLVESCMAIMVCVLFGLAAFTTNQRLLFALKSQKETVAATMVMQQRIEAIRAIAFSNIASASYVQSNIVAATTGSEAPLGNMTETVTISKYPDDGSAKNIIVRNSANPSGSVTSSNAALATATLLRVDVKLNWTSANGRSRTRQISTVAGIGNIGT